MNRKDEILIKELERNNLLEKMIPESALYLVARNSMQIYVEEQEVQSKELTIGELTKITHNSRVKLVSSCEHDWLACGNAFFLCGKECGEYQQR